MKRFIAGLSLGILTLLALAPSASGANDPAGRCTAAKLRAAGKVVAAVMGCQAKRAITGFGYSDCFIKANLKMVHAFEAAEHNGPCPGDLTTLKMILKTAIDDSVFQILPEQCSLQPNMFGSVECGSNPDDPCLSFSGCVLNHVDDPPRALFFCRCI
jgi:hypothetical protein